MKQKLVVQVNNYLYSYRAQMGYDSLHNSGENARDQQEASLRTQTYFRLFMS